MVMMIKGHGMSMCWIILLAETEATIFFFYKARVNAISYLLFCITKVTASNGDYVQLK
jgi:hypothetical protein